MSYQQEMLWRNILLTVLLLTLPAEMFIMSVLFFKQLPTWVCWTVGLSQVITDAVMLLAVLGLWNLHKEMPFLNRYF